MSLAKNSILYLISTICIRAVSFLLLPLYTYMVSPEEYGYVYVVSAFVTFMSMFLTFSLHGTVGRYYFECDNIEQIRKMYSQIVCYVVIVSIPILALLLLFSGGISSIIGLPLLYYKLAVWISFFSVFYNVIIALLYAREEAIKISITSIVIGVLTIVFQLLMVFNLEDKALGLILAMFINAILTFLIFIVYSIPFFTIPKLSRADCIKFFKYGLSQLPSDISGWFVSVSDRVLLNKMQGSYFAGVYGMGNTLGQVPAMIYQSVNKAYVPYVFRHYKSHENGIVGSLEELINTTTKVVSIITFVVVSLIILSNNIVALLDKRYVESSIIMPLVLFAVWIDCNRIIFMNPMAYKVEFVKIKSAIWVFAAIIDVSLNFYLIPRYSIYGACLSLIVSYGVTCVLILYFSNRAMKINYDISRIFKVVVISLFFSAAYFFGNSMFSLIIKVPLIIFYFIWILRINNMFYIINFIKKYV